MLKFRFRLERLLDIRKYREREWELKLAVITGICVSLENEIKDVLAEKSRSFRRRYELFGNDVNGLKTMELFMARLERKAEKLKKELAIRELEREEIQKQYLAVSKERKVLEKLKEKRADEYYREQMQEEMKVLDDISTGARAREFVREGMTSGQV